MKKFEVGKTYKVNGAGSIHVDKRTECYITFSGDYTGRKKIYPADLFGLGENILLNIPGLKQHKYFCFAAKEI